MGTHRTGAGSQLHFTRNMSMNIYRFLLMRIRQPALSLRSRVGRKPVWFGKRVITKVVNNAFVLELKRLFLFYKRSWSVSVFNISFITASTYSYLLLPIQSNNGRLAITTCAVLAYKKRVSLNSRTTYSRLLPRTFASFNSG